MTTKKKVTHKILSLFTVVLLVLLQGLSLVADAADGEKNSVNVKPAKNGVSSVCLDGSGKKIRITALLSEEFINAHQKAEIYIFELGTGQSERTVETLDPIKSYRITEKYILKIPLFDGSVSRLHHSYVIALKTGDKSYTPVGTRRYIDNVASFARYDYPYPKVSSPKGLETENVNDALYLNVSHAVIPVYAEKILEPYASIRTFRYDYCGETFYFNADCISSLDDKISSLSNRNVRVYLRFRLGTPAESLKELDYLGFPDSPRASGYSLHAQDGKGAVSLAAMFTFLAERYTNPDNEHGFCASFILGDDVNTPSLGYSCPETVGAMNHITNYAVLCRIAHTSLCSLYAEGKVFVSVGNNLNTVTAGLPSNNVSALRFLSEFNSFVTMTGDFDWSISASAYAYSRADSSIWDDALATGASTRLVSPANIGVLSSVLENDYRYKGKARSFIVGSFDVPSDGGEEAQAASYAYAYYKISGDGKAEAFIYSSQVDKPGDTHFYGLSRTDVTGNILNYKPIWSVFRSVDSDDQASLARFKSVAGGAYEYVYDENSEKAAVKKLTGGLGTASDAEEKEKSKVLFDFSEGDRHDFMNSGYGYVVKSDLKRDGNGSALMIRPGANYRLVKYGIDPDSLGNADKILLSLNECASDGILTLNLTQSDTLYYSSSAPYGKGASFVTFDISDFREKIGKEDICMSIQVTSAAENVFLRNVRTVSARRISSILPIIFVILAMAIVIAVILLLRSRFTRGRGGKGKRNSANPSDASDSSGMRFPRHSKRPGRSQTSEAEE